MNKMTSWKTNPAKNNVIPFSNENSLSFYLKEISNFRTLTTAEEKELAIKIGEGDLTAKKELINANLKLVVNIARRIVHQSNLPMIDLIQEGNLGLMIAVEKFNYKFGYKFATYASWWIKQAIFKAISEQGHSMRIPVYIQETLSKFSKVKREMEQKTNNIIKNEDVAKKINLDINKVNEYLNAYSKTISIEAGIEMQNGSELDIEDVLVDLKSNASKKIEEENLKNDIKEVLKNLKEKEAEVLKMRFGLNEIQKRTLEEIGKLYGVTKECIRQTEIRALRKIKSTPFSAELLSAYI